MAISKNRTSAAEGAREQGLPELGFEVIPRIPTASQITKCGDLQKEPAKVG